MKSVKFLREAGQLPLPGDSLKRWHEALAKELAAVAAARELLARTTGRAYVFVLVSPNNAETQREAYAAVSRARRWEPSVADIGIGSEHARPRDTTVVWRREVSVQ